MSAENASDDFDQVVEQNHLALAFFGPLPTSPEKCHLFFAVYPRNQARPGYDLETAVCPACTEHAIHFDRLGDPFQYLGSHAGTDEKPMDQLMGGRTDGR